MTRRLYPDARIGLSAFEAALIAASTKAIVGYWRAAGHIPPALVSLLEDLQAVAEEHKMASSTTASDPVSHCPAELIPILAGLAEPGGRSSWVSTQVAAQRLEVSQRRVVQLLREGRIAGRQRGGTSSNWQVQEQSLDEYAADRPIKPTDTEG